MSAEAEEVHCHKIYFEIRGPGTGKGHLVRPLPMQILHFMAEGADHVSMRGSIAVVAGHFMERIDFNDETKLAEGFQRLIDGIKGNHRQMAPYFLINILGAGMIVTRHDCL